MTSGYKNPGFKQTIVISMRTKENYDKIFNNNAVHSKNHVNMGKKMFSKVRDMWSDNYLATKSGRLFEEYMNRYEADNPPKMVEQSPTAFGELKTNYWCDTLVRMRSNGEPNKIYVDMWGRNKQPDFRYEIHVTKTDASGFPHNLIYRGIVGNLAARRLTRKNELYKAKEKVQIPQVSMRSLGFRYGRNKLDVVPEDANDRGAVDLAQRLSKRRRASLIMFVDGYENPKNDKAPKGIVFGTQWALRGSWKYRAAVKGYMRKAIRDSLLIYNHPKAKTETLRYDYNQLLSSEMRGE